MGDELEGLGLNWGCGEGRVIGIGKRLDFLDRLDIICVTLFNI